MTPRADDDGNPAPAPAWLMVPHSRVELAPGFEASVAAPVSLAIGIFDGVHRGHQAVLRSAREAAARKTGVTAVLTFQPHPTRILRPHEATRLLFDEATKSSLLFQHGVQVIIWRRFDEAFAQLTSEGFVEMLRENLQTLSSVHVGANFRFGKGRNGGPETFRALLEPAGIEVAAVPRIRWHEDQVSSTRLRRCLNEGAMEEVNAMLGSPYRTTGAVIAGRRVGRSIGFPTLNLLHAPECAPRYGVYTVRVRGPRASGIAGVANYGARPTVEAESVAPRLEVHVLEAMPAWDAGDVLTVEWLHFLRPEKRFGSVDALTAQIGRDVVKARRWFAEQPASAL